jgi:hypothetical protein
VNERFGAIVIALIAAVSLTGGLNREAEPNTQSSSVADATTTTEDTTVGLIEDAQARFETAIATLDEVMMAADPASGVPMAWEDLRGDTRSVIADLRRDPESVDARAVFGRVVSFWESYEWQPAIDPSSDVWQAYVSSLGNLLRHLVDGFAISDRPSALH